MDLDVLEMPPTRMLILGQPHWRWPDGTTAPVISGGDGDGDGDGDDPPEFQPITSQEEFDRMVSDRLKRERKKFPSAEELEELRTKAKAFDDAQQEQQSELDRERSSRETAEQERDRLREENRRIKIEAAIIAAASGKAEDPATVATLILADPDHTDAVTIDDAGQVTGADTAVTTLLEQKPFLAASGGGRKAVDQGQGKERGQQGARPTGLAAGRELYQQRFGNTTRKD